jgi:hypothetical protein
VEIAKKEYKKYFQWNLFLIFPILFWFFWYNRWRQLVHF